MSDYSYCDYQPVNTKMKINPFLLGLARLFDFTQSLNQIGPKKPKQVDGEAIKNDWEKIGQDLWFAVNKYSAENDKEQKTN
ncbi:MAG: hypothetical protein KAU01_03490 [Candidatus Cloacimonetes bacterium]|nr:hypothetical protein [Candidatus Cloacimonadota bacterium]